MNKGKMRAYIQIGFFVSVILNVVLLGFIVSGPLMMGLPFDPLGRVYKSALNLSPESKEAVLNILEEKQPRLEANVGQVMRTFKDAREKLTSKGLTEEDIEQIRNDMISNHTKMSTDLGDMLKEIAFSIKDEEERIKFFNEAMPKNPPFPAPLKKNATGIPGQDR